MSKYHKESQVNQYDKIFRENMEAALPGVIEHVLGLDIVHSAEIPDDIQHTKERKPDMLKKVTDSSGKTFVLHIEYQVKNEKQMVYRMAEYHIMLLRKYLLPVEQFVLFMGAGKASMPTEINEERHKFNYRLIALSEINYKIFLKSDKAEEKILAILANFENDGDDLALQNILKGVRATEQGDFAESRYFEQLRILAQLRKLDIKFAEAMESITKFFKEEKDPFFQRGEAKGEARGEARGRKEEAIAIAVEMKKEGFPIEQIVKFTKLSVDEIEKL
jgi:predicted transposase/invertase (TIGR01784 family)